MKINLNNSIGFRINNAANKLNISFNQILSKYDIASEQRVTLEIIKEEKKVTSTKIAYILSKDKTTISRTLRVLERKNLIQRREVLEDRRKNFIELTSKGIKTIKDSEEDINDFRNKLISNLSKEEVNILFNLLEKTTLNLGTSHNDKSK